KDLLASVEETANVSKVGGEEVSEFFLGEEIELPKGKVFEQDGDSAREGIFNGFEEVFFDDGMPEEDALANAISGEGFLPLGFSMLTEEERVEMLGMESQQNEIIEKYSFLFGDKTDEVLESVLTDADGNLLHLIDYLEDNNILMYLPEDAKVLVDGKAIERDDFIRDYLIPDITANGATNFFDYLENRGIEINCDKKNGFFQGI
ncbi:MAG: hypothetical protein K2I70_02965, partial [Bacilli bacterium]|nr:hypothetical protein [Bacilli bacterium]